MAEVLGVKSPPMSPYSRLDSTRCDTSERMSMTWSSLLSQHAGKMGGKGESPYALPDDFPKRWRLLIAVIDCTNCPKLLNPPRSVQDLKARLFSAFGIEARRHGSDPLAEASAQAIVTGLEGPERRPLESDEDLRHFIENLRKPVPFDSPGTSPLQRQGTRRDRLNRVSEKEEEEDDEDLEEFDLLARGWSSEKKETPREELEARHQATQRELEDCHADLEGMRRRLIDCETRIAEYDKRCNKLQGENLEYIRAFDQQLEQRRQELVSELDKKYQVFMMEQGKKLSEAQGQALNLEGELQLQITKVKDVEAQLREQRNAFVQLAAGFEEEREQFEEERRRLAAKVQRVRQLEFFADSWRRKVLELTDVTGKTLQLDSEGSLQYRITSIGIKLDMFQKGRLVQSPEFEVPELGKVQFEFFPTGDVNSKEGWCSFRLRVPDRTRLRWSAFIGKKQIGPRTDNFDSRQWWNRYGLMWLNFCLIEEVRPEILPETDSLLCGIEVHEILPALEDGDTQMVIESPPLGTSMPSRPRSALASSASTAAGLRSPPADRSSGLGSSLPVVASPATAAAVEFTPAGPPPQNGAAVASSAGRGQQAAATSGSSSGAQRWASADQAPPRILPLSANQVLLPSGAVGGSAPAGSSSSALPGATKRSSKLSRPRSVPTLGGWKQGPKHR
mmetsp:Transcript_129073/g.228352  ORF Transcript_129073/g.228352 Transcript_129073/m.228352 type:complete len:675 (+) Transcript_129073:66-2090(+)